MRTSVGAAMETWLRCGDMKSTSADRYIVNSGVSVLVVVFVEKALAVVLPGISRILRFLSQGLPFLDLVLEVLKDVKRTLTQDIPLIIHLLRATVAEGHGSPTFC
eukprot:scaffold1196_cov151-Pinguiococcus_pyrenoidosus.AAC.1